jgi:hypothetical protein
MTVAGRQRPGQNPAYKPADRPNRVFSHITRGALMSPRGRRIRCWLVVGVCQVVLVYLAGVAFAHRTVITWGGWGIPSSTGQYIFYGWPLVWSEYQQQGDRVGLGVLTGPPIRYDSGPIEFKGQNPAVPVLMFALAITLPPVAASMIPRRRGPDGLRQGPSWLVRLERVGLFAAAVGLAGTALELETGTYVFRLRDAELYGRGCTSGGLYGPTYFIDRTIFHYRNRPGTPYLIGDSKWYGEVRHHMVRYRQELTGEVSPLSAPLAEWPRPEDVWWFRTRLTLASTGLGLVLGCPIFRPWRRPPPDLAAGGTELG